MKKALTILLVSQLTLAQNVLAQQLSSEDKKNLSDAFKTNNQFIIDSVKNNINQRNQKLEKQTKNYLKSLKKPPQSKKKFKASVEGGITIESGNTQTESLYSKASTYFQINQKFSNKASIRAENKKENKIRTKEEYLIKNQTKYNINQKHYSFLELEFNSDRFSGFNYRLFETLGYGYNVLNSDKTNLSIESGAGLSQTKFTNNNKEGAWLAKFGLNFDHQFNNASFIQELDIAFNDENTVSNSDSGLKVILSDQLYLKLGLILEHQSNVEPNIKKLDSRTSLVIGYDF